MKDPICGVNATKQEKIRKISPAVGKREPRDSKKKKQLRPARNLREQKKSTEIGGYDEQGKP